MTLQAPPVPPTAPQRSPRGRHPFPPFWPADANGSLLLGLAGALAVLLWAGGNGYRQSLLVLGCMYALVALGMYVPFVMAGTLSMAYSAYAAVGGYAVGIIGQREGLPIWVGWLVAPPIAVALALVLGWATRRLSGFYLVAVTLLFAEAFQAWVQSASLAGGEGGLGNIPVLELFGWRVSATQFDIGAVVLVSLTAYVLDRLRLSRWGITVRAMRDVPHAVEAAGVRVSTMQLVALGLGAAIGSLGGAFFISSARAVTPITFTLNLVFIAVFMPIVGGVGTAWGAVLGAAVVADLTINIHALGQSGLLVVSLGVLAILLVAPRGIAGYLDQGRHWLADRVGRRG